MNSIRIFVTRQHGFITSWPQLSFVPLDCGCELAGRLLFHGAEVDEEVSSISNSVIQALAAVKSHGMRSIARKRNQPIPRIPWLRRPVPKSVMPDRCSWWDGSEDLVEGVAEGFSALVHGREDVVAFETGFCV